MQQSRKVKMHGTSCLYDLKALEAKETSQWACLHDIRLAKASKWKSFNTFPADLHPTLQDRLSKLVMNQGRCTAWQASALSQCCPDSSKTGTCSMLPC